MKTMITLLFSLLMLQSAAQEIAGKLLDEKREPLANARVQACQPGILKGESVTDCDGNYVIKPLAPGNYTEIFSCTGCDSVIITDVIISGDERVTVNNILPRAVNQSKSVTKLYRKPLNSTDKCSYHGGISRDEIMALPVGRTEDIVTNTGGVIQGGGHTSLPGCRAAGTLYIVDGNPVYRIQNCISNVPETKRNPMSYILTRDEIERMPVTDIRDLLAIFPGIYQPRRGDDVSVFGSRAGGSLYVVDGMR